MGRLVRDLSLPIAKCLIGCPSHDIPARIPDPSSPMIGRINPEVEPAHAVKRITDISDLIEVHHANAARRGIRLQLQITATTVSVVDNARPL